MAAVVTIERDIPLGQTEHLYECVIALDNSYPTGGYALDPSANTTLRRVICGNSGGYQFEFIPSSQKLKVYRGDNANAAAAPGVEVANGVDLSALSAIQAIALGA